MADPIEGIPRSESPAPAIERAGVSLAGRSKVQVRGTDSPDVGQKVAAPDVKLPGQRVDAEAAVAELNALPVLRDRGVSFAFNEAAGKTVISVVDRATGEQLKQIPLDELVALAEKLRALNETSALGSDAAGQIIDAFV